MRELPHYVDVVMKRRTNIGLYKAVEKYDLPAIHKLAKKK